MKNNVRSKCCKAKVQTMISSDFLGDNIHTMHIGTCYYVCEKCGRACDIMEDN